MSYNTDSNVSFNIYYGNHKYNIQKIYHLLTPKQTYDIGVYMKTMYVLKNYHVSYNNLCDDNKCGDIITHIVYKSDVPIINVIQKQHKFNKEDLIFKYGNYICGINELPIPSEIKQNIHKYINIMNIIYGPSLLSNIRNRTLSDILFINGNISI